MVRSAARLPSSRLPPVYPSLLAGCIVFAVWADTRMHPAGMYRSLLVAVVATLAITWVAGVLFADRDRGATFAVAAVAAVTLGHVPAIGLVIGFALVLLLVEGVVNRSRKQRLPRAVTRVLSVFVLALVGVVSVNAIQSGAIALAVDDITRDLAGRPAPTRESGGEAFPDIVLVMLDGYPGDDAAGLVPAFDADAFPDALTAMSFDVQRNSRSNYLYTPSTLASMFEMRHLLDIDRLAPWDAESLDDDRLRQLINTAAALQVLHDHGYELVAINAGYADTEIRSVDRWIDTGQPTEFEIALLRRTVLGSALEFVAPDLLSNLQRDRVHDTLSAVEAVVAEPGDRPRFVIAHVPSPHAPWVFDARGDPVRDPMASFFSDAPGARGLDRAGSLDRVFGQAAYIGTLTAQTLRRMANADGGPPVVVVFSDHGPGTGFNFADPLASDLDERSSNFLATLTPGRPGLFAERTTPVNVLPVLLDAYLGTNTPRSPDDTYGWDDDTLSLVNLGAVAE